MATGTRKKSGRKTSSRNSNTKKKNTKENTKAKKSTAENKEETTKAVTEEKNSTGDFTKQHGEILMLVLVALAVFLLLGNFGKCGTIGNGLSNICFGLFGILQYVLPIVCLLGALLLIANNFSRKAAKKVGLSFVILVCLCIYAQMLYEQNIGSLADVYNNAVSSRMGGGVIGALFMSLFLKTIGTAGTILVTLLVFAIAAVLLTEVQFFESVKSIFREKDHSDRRERYDSVAEESAEEPVADTTKREAPKKSTWRRGPISKAPVFDIDDDFDDPVPETTADSGTSNGFLKKKKDRKPIEVPADFTISGAVDEGGKELIPDVEEPVRRKEPVIRKTPAVKIDNEPVVVTPSKPVVARDSSYILPSTNLLTKPKSQTGTTQSELRETADKLQQTLENFGVHVTITNISCGPAITRFELQPEQGVKVSRIVSLSDDIKLNLAAADIRIEAPIPGKAAIGIEIPNKTNQMVSLRDMIESQEFQQFKSPIGFTVGKDLTGKPVIANIESMPHLLIAGATGSGKSVCINTIIMSILYKADPRDVKLIMIDPKVVELSVYNGIPHLLIPVVTDPKKAAGALNWAVMEMGERYKRFSEIQVRNIKAYNQKVDEAKANGLEGNDFERMPQIVVIVDELADLMMVASKDVEDAIVRLTQLARAAGIHLVIATQRPSVNVITGLIKANVPSRIAFAVSSGVDSRTIIDMNGAEKLLGKGDMLFYPQGYKNPIRVQGAFVSDEEVSHVVNYLREQAGTGEEDSNKADIQKKIEENTMKVASSGGSDPNGRDEYFFEAAEFIIDKDKASIASLQRIFKIGFNRASRLMEQLCEAGVVGEEVGTKPRKVIMSKEQFEQMKEEEM